MIYQPFYAHAILGPHIRSPGRFIQKIRPKVLPDGTIEICGLKNHGDISEEFMLRYRNTLLYGFSHPEMIDLER